MANENSNKFEFTEGIISRNLSYRLSAAVLSFLAIVVGLYVFKSASVAIGSYYFVIVCVVAMCSPVDLFKSLFVGWHSRAVIIFVGVTAMVGPAILFFWPRAMLDGIVLSDMIGQYGIDAGAIGPFSMAAVIINPIMEEVYWRGCLPGKTAGPGWVDVAFGACHVPILMLVIRPQFIVGVFIVLVCAGWAFRYIRLKTGGLLVSWIGHAVADAGIGWAIWHILRSAD